MAKKKKKMKPLFAILTKLTHGTFSNYFDRTITWSTTKSNDVNTHLKKLQYTPKINGDIPKCMPKGILNFSIVKV